MNKEEFLAAYAAGDRDFRGANLTGADLRDAILTGADLSGANLRRADLRFVALARADLRDAILMGADLRSVDFTGADFTGAILTGANLTGAWLQGADLTGADLSGADLSGAVLRGANLTGANLTGANLRWANLTSVDLTGAIGFRFSGSPDPLDLRQRVAAQIQEHPELHDQREWGENTDEATCGTPCCVAGWACRLGGGARGHRISTAATLLLYCAGYRVPPFDADASREAILRDLLVPIKDQQ